MTLSLPSPPPLQADFVFPIGREAYFVSGKQVMVKVEEQISAVKGIEKNEMCCVYERNVLQKNISFETDSSRSLQLGKVKGIKMAWKRPSSLIIPDLCSTIGFHEEDKRIESQEIEVKGIGHFLASKKGRKEVMEDSFGISLNISGDPKQVRKNKLLDHHDYEIRK